MAIETQWILWSMVTNMGGTNLGLLANEKRVILKAPIFFEGTCIISGHFLDGLRQRCSKLVLKLGLVLFRKLIYMFQRKWGELFSSLCGIMWRAVNITFWTRWAIERIGPENRDDRTYSQDYTMQYKGCIWGYILLWGGIVKLLKVIHGKFL